MWLERHLQGGSKVDCTREGGWKAYFLQHDSKVVGDIVLLTWEWDFGWRSAGPQEQDGLHRSPTKTNRSPNENNSIGVQRAIINRE